MQYKIKHKINFCRLLEEVGLIRRKDDTIYFYDISYEQLKSISDKFHWVHELDEAEKEQCFFDEQESDNESIQPVKYIVEKDKAEYVRAEEYKSLENKLNNKLEHQNENIETLKDEFTNAMQYIKQLEEHIKQMETNNIEKKPTKKKTTKKQTNDDEYVTVADGVYINKSTGDIIDQECEIDDIEIF
jgi:predicted RNase H-like nuclease (RuvC/YqgF family)